MTLLTDLKEGLGISWSAIRANKLRSVLTTLGIVIGILTVTLMGTAIEGLNRAFFQSISFMGADVLYVHRFNFFSQSQEAWVKMEKRRQLTLEQARALEKQLTLARAVAPDAERDLPIKYKKRQSNGATIIGTTEQYLDTTSIVIAQGRFLTPVEIKGGRPVCVIGSAVATNLFPREQALGNKVTIGQQAFEVVGVMEHQGSILDGGSLDNQAIVPLSLFTASFWSTPDYGIRVKVKDLAQLEDAKEEIRCVMRGIRRLAPGDPDDFGIHQQDQFVQIFHQIAGTIAAIGLFITGLSLFVGGIGIMNIMFVSVAERTREIGIRKAIGAKRRSILLQFLMEAASICLLGGMLGLGLAWPLTLVLQKFMPATLSLLVVSLALGVALVTGVLSGFFPAWRAARMNPVDALRNE